MSIKILVVEDEMRIRKIIKDYLENDGYEVIEAKDGKEALEKFYSNSDLSLIILDIMMPKLNGWKVCAEIREESNIPIIFLTALGESYDEIKGLHIGADDYIRKPFRYEVFMARIKAILRRINENIDSIYEIGDLEINRDSMTIKYKQKYVEMAPKEYEILLYLIDNKNKAIDRDKILDNIWGHDFYGDRRTVDTHIKTIRAKIDPRGEYIKTIRGVGYKFEVKS